MNEVCIPKTPEPTTLRDKLIIEIWKQEARHEWHEAGGSPDEKFLHALACYMTWNGLHIRFDKSDIKGVPKEPLLSRMCAALDAIRQQKTTEKVQGEF